MTRGDDIFWYLDAQHPAASPQPVVQLRQLSELLRQLPLGRQQKLLEHVLALARSELTQAATPPPSSGTDRVSTPYPRRPPLGG